MRNLPLRVLALCAAVLGKADAISNPSLANKAWKQRRKGILLGPGLPLDIPVARVSYFLGSDGSMQDGRKNAQAHTHTSTFSLVSDIWNLSEDAYSTRVLAAGAVDMLTRWARRGRPIPTSILESATTPAAIGKGLYETLKETLNTTKTLAALAADKDTQTCLPTSRQSLCPGSRNLGQPKAELVVSAYDSDVSWLANVEMPVTVYVHNRTAHRSHCVSNGARCVSNATGLSERLQKASESQHRLQARSWSRPNLQPIRFVDVPNVGDEALAYFSFIITRYDSLPDFVFFAHDHQCAWHATHDMGAVLKRTLPCIAKSKVGYMNLNDGPADKGFQEPECYYTFPGAQRQGSEITEAQAADHRGLELPRVWDELFKPFLGDMPIRYCMDCCAQFAVSRERLKSHTLDFYRRQLAAVKAGKTSFEYFWRMLFVANFD